MSDELAEFFAHTITVETFVDTSGYGVDLFAAPVTLDPATDTGVFVEQKRREVRDKDGGIVISETTVYARTAAAAVFVPNSRVTYGDVQSRVITVAVNELDTLDLPSHIAVALT
jgi:hypothetical protein